MNQPSTIECQLVMQSSAINFQEKQTITTEDLDKNNTHTFQGQYSRILRDACDQVILMQGKYSTPKQRLTKVICISICFYIWWGIQHGESYKHYNNNPQFTDNSLMLLPFFSLIVTSYSAVKIYQVEYMQRHTCMTS